MIFLPVAVRVSDEAVEALRKNMQIMSILASP